MPPDRTRGMIDGFSSVQAIRRQDGVSKKQDPASKPETATPHAPMGEGGGQSRSASSAGAAAHIGTTAMPTRHELVCYSCGYAFTVTGRLEKLFCSKCRTQLETGSVRIEGNWSEDVKTVGVVEILPQAVVKGATLTGTDIRIAGDVTDATLKPTRRLELADGAQVPLAVLRDQDLWICEGAELRMDGPVYCRNIEIYGLLRADLYPSGSVTIKPGGCLSGSLQSAHLIVEDGGGLLADVRVGGGSRG